MARAGKAKPLVKKVSSAVRVSALIELMRVRNCLMAAIAVAIGFFLVGGLEPLFLAAVMFSAFLICAGGQVINDVFDFEIDAKLSKTKPSKVPPKSSSSFASRIAGRHSQSFRPLRGAARVSPRAAA